ncbi:MAG: hypothetical protein GDA38_12060 [Hormoscilla sp. SP12CHS1]|nr:hypothetical protein [Hormoscilla sp. SP12CHS1]
MAIDLYHLRKKNATIILRIILLVGFNSYLAPLSTRGRASFPSFLGSAWERGERGEILSATRLQVGFNPLGASKPGSRLVTPGFEPTAGHEAYREWCKIESGNRLYLLACVIPREVRLAFPGDSVGLQPPGGHET